MKKLITLFTAFVVSVQILFSAANLVVTVGTVSKSAITYDETVVFKATVKNVGNITAEPSLTYLSIATQRNFSDESIVTRTPVRALKPNESIDIEFVAPITNGVTASGNYFVAVEVDVENQVAESDENNSYLIGNFTLATIRYQSRKTPCPIIFIHGLVGDASTWNPLTDNLDKVYGYTYGGNMNFCLNYDSDTKKSLFSTDYKNFDSPITEGDYYYVNFAVKPSGTTYSSAIANENSSWQSNQSAIFKQGRAVRDAIAKVLKVNKCEEVILVGHSMGGLAAREYLQNSSIYVSASGSVAKLFTIGTPHGGSNQTSLILGKLFAGIDERSEAVRDLRYPFLPLVGRYLFGGTESNATSYNNIDVNCNGIIGDNIVGLNEKTLPIDVNYACIIGTADKTFGIASGDDGIVTKDRANLQIFPPNSGIVCDTFIDNEKLTSEPYQHSELHRKLKTCIKGLDEPDDYNKAFGIELNKQFYGTITFQSRPTQNLIDYDDFSFYTPQNGKIRLKIANLPCTDFSVDVLDANGRKIVRTIGGNVRSNIDTVVSVKSGYYYLEMYGTPNTDSYQFPYAYQVAFTPDATPTMELTESQIKVYPNPTSTVLNIELPENTSSVFEVFLTDIVGKVMKKDVLAGQKTSIDVSELPNGLYFAQILEGGKVVGVKKFVVEK